MTSCKNEGLDFESYIVDDEIEILDWDNKKYDMWDSSVGLDVYNENSFTNFDENILYKWINTLYITDLDEPIILKFNNNGSDKNYILSIFYDYKQIPFKIKSEGDYNINYIFELEDSKEIKLPLYLPDDLVMDDSHKLLVSFVMKPEIHAKDLDGLSNWYGINLVYDIIYNNDEKNFNFYYEKDELNYEEILNTIDLTYEFNLNEDFEYSILETEIMPNPSKLIKVKKGNKFNLVYNISTIGNDTENVLMLVNYNFNQTMIDGNYNYKLFKVPKDKTGVGTIELLAPDEVGLYEVTALLVYNPFEKINMENDYTVDTNMRFTLEVVE